MEQTGEHVIECARERVWEALNDPEVLKRCIDGCRSMEPVGDDRFAAAVVARVGPVRATFQAEIELRDVVPPVSYRLEVQVKRGVAGHAKGSATVELDAVADERTRLRYRIEGGVGGKLAQIGSRLVSGAARNFADRFFERFAEDVASTAT